MNEMLIAILFVVITLIHQGGCYGKRSSIILYHGIPNHGDSIPFTCSIQALRVGYNKHIVKKAHGARLSFKYINRKEWTTVIYVDRRLYRREISNRTTHINGKKEAKWVVHWFPDSGDPGFNATMKGMSCFDAGHYKCEILYKMPQLPTTMTEADQEIIECPRTRTGWYFVYQYPIVWNIQIVGDLRRLLFPAKGSVASGINPPSLAWTLLPVMVGLYSLNQFKMPLN